MSKEGKVQLDHGGGGKASRDIVQNVIVPHLGNTILDELNDGAVFQCAAANFAMSTDSYVVDPIFFPGGDIGRLAVCGTVNDLAMCGAKPLYLSAALILEEGFDLSDLDTVLKSMEETCAEAHVLIVTGDTKVVPKGKADKIFINTTGIGEVPKHVNISGRNARVGDRIIVSGTIGDHGVAIISQREGLELGYPLKSDVAPLNKMVLDMIEVSTNIHVLRDPTRGGLGTVLNEISMQSNVGIKIFEERIPIKDEVRGACELLGWDPIYVGNEGKLVAFVDPVDEDKVLTCIRSSQYGKDADVIGEVTSEHQRRVVMRTRIGGTRIVDLLTGDQLPRIC